MLLSCWFSGQGGHAPEHIIHECEHKLLTLLEIILLKNHSFPHISANSMYIFSSGKTLRLLTICNRTKILITLVITGLESALG